MLVPFIAIKFIKTLFLSNFNDTLPISIQIVIIVFSVMSIILIGLLVFITISFMFKSDWIIQETDGIDLSMWIENYEPNNTTNDECDQNTKIVFISLIKHFLACTFKEKKLTFKLLKSKITRFNRMRNIPQLAN